MNCMNKCREYSVVYKQVLKITLFCTQNVMSVSQDIREIRKCIKIYYIFNLIPLSPEEQQIYGNNKCQKIL